ncbi:MAG TPA: alpha/beta hydrolase [Aquaticitalea sp.]|nr:alpha/beta hydrolase [Aquaticitalea sp.]
MRLLLAKTVGCFYNLVSFFSKKTAAKVALVLFTTPQKGRKLTEEQRDFLDTAFQKEHKYGTHTIMTYRWLGNKPTVLLVHGWQSNSHRWKAIILELKKRGHSVVALDAPGHGNSSGRRFNAVLYSEFINIVATRFQPEIIVAHSVGGMATAIFQHKYQLDSVKKIVLLGAPSEFTDVLKRYTDMLGFNKRITQQMNRTIIEKLGNAPENYSTAKFLKDTDLQGLIIHDKEDNIIPYKDAIRISNSFKNSKLITTKGQGHSLNNEMVASHIYEFIDT